ncbi:hypothetical protein A3D23_02570 [candidate division WOR-1 bacterium RIFCSPHIGHO2_02_FULL_53_26]|nr:MAG: hypothetical protein A3D23_02570 [candidate division WOR-1 bacterium RIFCSPHIGHO2_02_FULL_53_26]
MQGRQFKATSKLGRLPISLHDFGKAQNIFASQETFRNQVLKFGEGVDLVSGEVNGEIFVLEAAQAKTLIENALDAQNLIAGLKP